jgi:hypothetical protein
LDMGPRGYRTLRRLACCGHVGRASACPEILWLAQLRITSLVNPPAAPIITLFS